MVAFESDQSPKIGLKLQSSPVLEIHGELDLVLSLLRLFVDQVPGKRAHT